MRKIKFLLVLFYISITIIFIFRFNRDISNIDIDFDNPNPSEIYGCYNYEGSIIKLNKRFAYFDGVKVKVSYRRRKGLSEVLHLETYPWYDEKSHMFVFEEDRFDIVDVFREDEKLSVKIWSANYLNSRDPKNLKAIYFQRSLCE